MVHRSGGVGEGGRERESFKQAGTGDDSSWAGVKEKRGPFLERADKGVNQSVSRAGRVCVRLRLH